MEEVNSSTVLPNSLPVESGMWEIGGTRLNVRVVGDGPPVVLLHGGPGGNLGTFRGIEEALGQDFQLIMYDQRGSGDSERLDIDVADLDPSLISVERHVADLEELRERLGVQRLTILGHSWGATLATFYAAEHPDRIEQLILVAGGPEWAEIGAAKDEETRRRLPPAVAEAVGAKMQQLQQNIGSWTQDELDEFVISYISMVAPALRCDWEREDVWSHEHDFGRGGFWANQLSNRYRDDFDMEQFQPRLADVDAKVLLIAGACDVSPITRQTVLAEGFPNATLVVFEHSGHQPQDEQTDVFVETVRAFLTGAVLPMRASDPASL